MNLVFRSLSVSFLLARNVSLTIVLFRGRIVPRWWSLCLESLLSWDMSLGTFSSPPSPVLVNARMLEPYWPGVYVLGCKASDQSSQNGLETPTAGLDQNEWWSIFVGSSKLSTNLGGHYMTPTHDPGTFLSRNGEIPQNYYTFACEFAESPTYTFLKEFLNNQQY